MLTSVLIRVVVFCAIGQPASAPAALHSISRDSASASFDPRVCPAVVVPRRAVLVSAPRDGVVESISVVLGQQVKTGDVLAVMESRGLQLELDAARVGLTEARGQRQKASIQLERATELCKHVSARLEAFSEKERKDAEYERQIAVEELRIAETRIERQSLEVGRLEDLLQRSRMEAPFDGTIAARYVEVGASLARGAAVVRLISSDDLVVRFAAPPERAARLRIGHTVTFRPLDSVAAWSVRVCRIAPEIDPDLQAVVVEADLVAPAGATATAPGTHVQAGVEGRVLLE